MSPSSPTAAPRSARQQTRRARGERLALGNSRTGRRPEGDSPFRVHPDYWGSICTSTTAMIKTTITKIAGVRSAIRLASSHSRQGRASAAAQAEMAFPPRVEDEETAALSWYPPSVTVTY